MDRVSESLQYLVETVNVASFGLAEKYLFGLFASESKHAFGSSSQSPSMLESEGMLVDGTILCVNPR